jgi:hypothetical protein
MSSDGKERRAMEPKIPSLYQKRDQNFYFTFKGKQYYAGSTREAATQKLLEIVGTANSNGPHSIKDAVREYLASIEGVQSSPPPEYSPRSWRS